MVDRLTAADDAPWSEWHGMNGNQQPRQLSQGELARLLEPFQIRPRTIRIFAAASGRPTLKGYYRAVRGGVALLLQRRRHAVTTQKYQAFAERVARHMPPKARAAVPWCCEF
jgi:hypothetical protein